MIREVLSSHVGRDIFPSGVPFGGLSSSENVATQPLERVRLAVGGLTPIFSFRRGHSPEAERQLDRDTQAYNVAKDALETMLNPEIHAQVTTIYEDLMKRYEASQRGVSITLFGRSLSFSLRRTPKEFASETVDTRYAPPFLSRQGVAPAPSVVLGSD